MVKYTNLKHNYLLKTVLRHHRVLKVTWTVEHLFRKEAEFMPLSYLKIARIFFFFFLMNTVLMATEGGSLSTHICRALRSMFMASQQQSLWLSCVGIMICLFFLLYAAGRNNLSTHLFFFAPLVF